MAENIQETKPPEPPPRPPEVPKPTEQPDRSDGPASFAESQQSAQQDTRNAAQSEYAKAMEGREPDGLRPTPEFEAQLDEHTTAETEGTGAAAQDSDDTKLSQDSPTAPDPQDSASPAGDQAGEHAAARQGVGAERIKATEDTVDPEPTSAQDVDQPPSDQDTQRGSAGEEKDPGQPEAGQIPSGQASEDLDPAGDLRTDVTETDADDLAEVGDGSGPWHDEGTNHREGGAVQQMTDGSCVSASGEMLTEGRITQPELLSELGDWSNLSALRNELNERDGAGSWTGHYFEDGSAALRQASEGPMAAQVQAPLGRAHMVILEPGENGSFTVRDPYEGSSYDVDSSWVEKYVAGGVFQ